MVKNSDKTYGEHILDAMRMTGRQEVGETLEGLNEHFAKIFCEAIEGNKHITCDWYIWVFVRNDGYADNATHLIPITRKTRPSPYAWQDHYLWKYSPSRSELKFEWCIPKPEVIANVLQNPNNYHPEWVRMLISYAKGELDKEYILKEKEKASQITSESLFQTNPKVSKKIQIVDALGKVV